jgi:hypothetical protein
MQNVEIAECDEYTSLYRHEQYTCVSLAIPHVGLIVHYVSNQSRPYNMPSESVWLVPGTHDE